MNDTNAASEPAAAPAPVPAADVVVAAAPLPELEGEGKKRWLIIAGGKIPPGDTRPVIVVEQRGAPTTTPAASPEGEPVVTQGEIKLTGYPTKAALYLRVTPEVEFSGDAPVLTVGQEIKQMGFWGFAPETGKVHVGPHPAWAAANIAWQKGATDIEIAGLTDDEKARLQPFVDNLPTRKTFGATDVKIRLT